MQTPKRCLLSTQQRCVQPARHHQMRGWGFTKKLEPIVWLSALLGRGRCGRQSHRCSAQAPRGEGKSCPDQRRGKRESSSAPLPPEDETCKHALLCSPHCSALLSPPLLSFSACCPHRPSDLSNLLAATACTPRSRIPAPACAAVNFGFRQFGWPATPALPSKSLRVLFDIASGPPQRAAELFCSSQAQLP